MAIIHDYDGIAAELHRMRAEKKRHETRSHMHPEPEPKHRMRPTAAGNRLYRRLSRSSTGGAAGVTVVTSWAVTLRC